MNPYPKTVQTNHDLLKDLEAKGMTIPDFVKAEEIIQQIGYYRFRGYAFHLLDSITGNFPQNTSFDDVLHLYQFNAELTSLLFSMTSQIEVALRARLANALLSLGEPLIYLDPTVFKDKPTHWKNLASLSNEIARSDEVFIVHNYNNHNGQIPLWAAVEVMSFGTLSKFIRNLNTGAGSPFQTLAAYYSYTSSKGKTVLPSMDTLSSWIHVVVILRNICAHNSRIYNRSINKKPTILQADQQNPPPRYFGLCADIASGIDGQRIRDRNSTSIHHTRLFRVVCVDEVAVGIRFIIGTVDVTITQGQLQVGRQLAAPLVGNTVLLGLLDGGAELFNGLDVAFWNDERQRKFRVRAIDALGLEQVNERCAALASDNLSSDGA